MAIYINLKFGDFVALAPLQKRRQIVAIKHVAIKVWNDTVGAKPPQEQQVIRILNLDRVKCGQDHLPQGFALPLAFFH